MPVLLIGFSQGGLVAVTIGYNNATQYKLNIQGIALIQTPLNGVLPFGPGMKDVGRFAQKGGKGFNKLGVNACASVGKMVGAKIGVNVSRGLKSFGYETAIEFMRPNAESIKACSDFVRKNIDASRKPHDIPILLMSGYIQDPLSLLEYHSNDEKAIEAYRGAFKKFVGGSTNGGVVSLEGQLCRGKSVEDLADFRHDVMPNKPDNVEVHIAEKDTWHGQGAYKSIFTTFDDFKVVEGSKEVFDHEESKYTLSQWLYNRIEELNEGSKN